MMKGIAALPRVSAPRLAEVRPKTIAVVEETTILRSILLSDICKEGYNTPGPLDMPKPERIETREALPTWADPSWNFCQSDLMDDGYLVRHCTKGNGSSLGCEW
jgi:hypothetical protein